MESDQLELEMLHAALEHSGFGIAVLDKSGRILLANQNFGSLLGVATAKLLGGSYLELFATFASNSDFHRIFRHGEKPCSSEFLDTDSDGTVRYLLIKGRDVDLGTTGPYRIVSAFDATTFGVAPLRLDAYRRQLDTLTSAIVVVDATKPDLPIAYVNAAFEDMTGYIASDAIGKNCRFLQGPDTRPEALAHISKAVSAGKSCHAVLLNYRKSGEPFLNELFISPVFDTAGSLTQFIGVQHEIPADSKPQGGVR